MTENIQTTEQTQPQPVKRGRGRPKGSTKRSKSVLPTEKPKTDQNAPQSNYDKLTTLLRVTGAKYDNLDPEVYQNKLDQMTLNDLYEEATRVGLKPLNDRSLTTRTLLELFHEERRRFLPSNPGEIKNDLDQDKQNKLRSLMRDGR